MGGWAGVSRVTKLVSSSPSFKPYALMWTVLSQNVEGREWEGKDTNKQLCYQKLILKIWKHIVLKITFTGQVKHSRE